MEQWNNVELNDLSKKSYTLNHDYDAIMKQKRGSVHNNGNADAAATTDANNANDNKRSDILQPGSDIKPKINMEQVESLARRLYGITISEIRELLSYDDRNYYIVEDRNIKNPLIISHWPHGYVLKILNALDSKKTDFVDAQNELMIHLSKNGIQCPKPISNVNGKHFSVECINGNDHIVRLLEYVPGQMFHQVEKTNYLLFQSGEYLAKIDRVLKSYTNKAYDSHKSTWMLESVPKLKDFMYVLRDHTRKGMVEAIIDAFERHILVDMDKFDKQVIHGDYNEQNIIVNQTTGKPNDEYMVTGVIDFGDTNKSPIIFEIGIAMTYMMLQAKTLESGGIFLAGYTSVLPISDNEKKCLKYCVAARLAQSLVMGAYTHSLDPSNEYVLVTQEQGWKLIEELWCMQFQKIDEIWQTTADKYLTQSTK